MTIKARLSALESKRTVNPFDGMTDAELDKRLAQVRALLLAAGDVEAFDTMARAHGWTDADIEAIERLADALPYQVSVH